MRELQAFDKKYVDELAKNYKFSPWGKGSNHHIALSDFLKEYKGFEIEDSWHKKNMITNCFG